MSRNFLGACCAIFMVVLLMTIAWLPAGAEEAPRFEGKEIATTEESLATRQEISALPEIIAERAAERRINKILDTMLKAPIEFLETPLNDVVSILQKDYDIPILLDVVALDDVGISPETKVSINLRGITMRAALELILLQVRDLTYTIQKQVLLITSEEVAREHLVARVYRVDDIVLGNSQRFNGRFDEEYFDELIDMLVASIEAESWMENGTGEGVIQILQPGMLIISQTPRVHRQIVRLLADIRETKRQIDTTADHQTTPVKPITRGIAIDVERGENPEEVNRQIAEALMKSVDWKVATSGLSEEDVWLRVLPDRLLVRHLPNVVRQVERVARDMQLVKYDTGGAIGCAPVRSGGGGGGF